MDTRALEEHFEIDPVDEERAPLSEATRREDTAQDQPPHSPAAHPERARHLSRPHPLLDSGSHHLGYRRCPHFRTRCPIRGALGVVRPSDENGRPMPVAYLSPESDWTRREIAEPLAAGASFTELARRHGISMQAVYRRLEQLDREKRRLLSPEACRCGCGRPIPVNATQRRDYATESCRSRAARTRAKTAEKRAAAALALRQSVEIMTAGGLLSPSNGVVHVEERLDPHRRPSRTRGAPRHETADGADI